MDDNFAKLNSDLYISLMKLNEICEVYSGYAIKEFNNIKKGLPVIKIGNILTDGTLNLGECQFSAEDINEKYHSKKGDIYVALSGATTGKLGIMEDEKKYIINQRVGIIRLKQKSVSQSYIKFFLLKQTERIIDEATGCAQPNISPKQIGEYDVPVFPEKEMLQISDILNNIVCVIKHYKAMIKKYDDLIKARFIEMFGDPQINKKGFTKAPMGEYLSLLTDFSSNGSYKALDSGVVMYDEPNYAWMVRTTDLESGDKSSIKYIDEKAYELLSKSKIFGGEIIMNKIGSAGKIYIIPKLTMPASLGRNAFMFRYDERINNIFMYYLLTSDYGQREIQQYVRGAVTKTITKDDARAVLIIVPPLELQQQFADFVQQVDKSRFVLDESIIKLEREIVYD